MGHEDRALRASLWLTALTALALLARAVVWLSQGAYVYIRPYCTVATAVLLLASAVAALRGRTWGVVTTSVCAAAFAGAALLGIGPTWFLVIAAVSVAPTLAASRHLFGFDARAATAAIVIALTAGGLAALAAGPGLEMMRGW